MDSRQSQSGDQSYLSARSRNFLCEPPTQLNNSRPHLVWLRACCPLWKRAAQVGPAQSEIEREVPMELEVVLDKQPPDIRPVILAKGGWEPGRRIEPTPFVVRRIIEEI